MKKGSDDQTELTEVRNNEWTISIYKE